MNRRRSLAVAAGVIALLLLGMTPLAATMSGAVQEDAQSAARIERAHEMMREYTANAPDIPVGPMMDIEDAWAIEDTREEAQTLLVTAMQNGGDALGFDAQSNTFYCTVGMEGDWPALSLTAQSAADAQELRLSWIDDYTYDSREDAVAEGYRYELLAYTPTQYAYIGVVFTGLPIVTLHTQEDIGLENVATRVGISGAGYEPVHSAALTHMRGGPFSFNRKKPSYRVKLRTLSRKGKDSRNTVSVLGMEPESDWLLIGGTFSVGQIRNHLCWGIWRDWTDRHQFGELEHRMVEVFRNDSYLGIYLLMEYVNAQEEIEEAGGNLETDVCVRRIIRQNQGDRPRWHPDPENNLEVELRCAPAHMTAEEAFSVFEPIRQIVLSSPDVYSDEEFEQIVLSSFDLRDLAEYYLFFQSMDLFDNYTNNLYIWAMKQGDGSYRYSFSPWDMDRCLCSDRDMDMVLRGEVPDAINHEMVFFERMMELNTGGIRELLWALWQEKRATLLEPEALYAMITGLENEMNSTGAPLRDSRAFGWEETLLDISKMYDNLVLRLDMFDQYILEHWPPQSAQRR